MGDVRDHVVDGPSVSLEHARRLHEVETACRLLAAPAEPGRSVDEIRGWFLQSPAFERRRLWLAAGGAAWLSCRADGTGNAQVMMVPGRRGVGVGSRLFAAVVAHARTAGARTLLGLCDDEASVRFLERRGCRRGRSFLRQVLELDGAPGAPDPAALSWRDGAPEALLPSYAVARNAINDAPSDEAEAWEWSGERVREIERAVAARGRETHVTVLLDGDRVVAFTELRVSRAEGAVASTEDTAVLPAYRGRGLATRLKAASLRELRIRRPDVRRVTTTNEVTNAPMLAVNRKEGFVPVATRTQMRLDLGSDG